MEVTLKRVNEIGITYVEGTIEDSHYEIIIEKLLGILENEVVGIDDRGKTRFLFEVSTQTKYKDICEKFTGRDITIEKGFVIRVDDISSYSTEVKLSRVPFKVNNDMLIGALTKYGQVEKIKSHFKTFGKYSNNKKTGYRIALMKLKKPIPQSLTIKQTQTTIYVRYEDQPFTCNKCGHTGGHREMDCITPQKYYKNIIDVKVNDPSSPIEAESDNNGGLLKCSECNYTCKGDSNLKEHEKTHIGEKSFICAECGCQFSEANELEMHMQIHSGEKPFKCHLCDFIAKNETEQKDHDLMHEDKTLFSCSECKFTCNEEDDLIAHLKSHVQFCCNECSFIGNSKQLLADHIKTHNPSNPSKKQIGKKGEDKTFSDVVKSPSDKNTSTSNTGKRGLSVSPVENTSRKSYKSINFRGVSNNSFRG